MTGRNMESSVRGTGHSQQLPNHDNNDEIDIRDCESVLQIYNNHPWPSRNIPLLIVNMWKVIEVGEVECGRTVL